MHLYSTFDAIQLHKAMYDRFCYQQVTIEAHYQPDIFVIYFALLF